MRADLYKGKCNNSLKITHRNIEIGNCKWETTNKDLQIKKSKYENR